MKTPARKMTVTTTNRKDQTHHFFVSSCAAWRVGCDVAGLIAAMKKEGYPFNVWYVPGSKEQNYEIEMYAPQVDGAVWIAFYGFDKD